jgi:thiamine pyrophosphate-dependent acetolactate synthase large subunit-like protein
MEITMSHGSRKWLDNAFWHNEEKDRAEAILVITDAAGREISQVLTVRKYDVDGDINPDFEELLEQVGEEQIDASTAERKERKAKEKEEDQHRKKAEEQARELERLFDAKIKMLEIDEIKNTKNKELKSKMRRSKNIVELNLFAQLIMMEELGIGFSLNEATGSD